ncbi:hypothetical protein [Nostoc sp. FACHB-110]|uniref:hypothetical protein n=1 Tax=Nostoc sp. FACHB-110 TaxID=2692834 RepID=UPI0016841194|nr:hypothetical protein [Nostoc sp. FACHB-110]MBD2436447.1 hypothetical protein [Nostoc sp. FACHB-110]
MIPASTDRIPHILHLAPANGIRGYTNVDAQAASRRVVRLSRLRCAWRTTRTSLNSSKDSCHR